MTSTSTLATAFAATLSAALLSACSGPDSSALAHSAAGARHAVVELGTVNSEPVTGAVQATQQLARNIAASVRDLTITAHVNAELALDQTLGASPIAVRTQSGRVLLTGVAPDRAARERAGQLAAGITGVTAVDNRLVVDHRG